MLVVGVLAVGLAERAGAATVRVPADHATIQAGVLAASPGDTVLVEPGRYRELIRMKAGVVLLSAQGPDSTIIVSPDLEEDALKERVLEIMEGDRSTVVEGFGFERGQAIGTAIYVEKASPTIRGNVIRDFGWAIQMRESEAALIEDNIMADCRTFAMLIFASSPDVFRNEFRNNSPRAISISGKDSKPLIGGSPENSNRIYGNVVAIVNGSRNDIDATYNDWGWEITTEMESREYPTDVSVLLDGNDSAKSAAGRGKVDYRHWVTAESGDEGKRVRFRLPLLVPIALVLIAVFVVLSRRR